MCKQLRKYLLPVLAFAGIMPLGGGAGPGNTGGKPPDDDKP